MIENKALFVERLGDLLTQYDCRTDVDHLEYVSNNGDEFVRIVFKNCHSQMVCVTMDSNIAIMLDVAKALCY